MPCTVVVGGQFGSEGKGKVINALASSYDESIVVRCGGPNAGHSTFFNGNDVIVRQIPSAINVKSAQLVISAGSLVNLDILLEEIEKFSISRERILVDSMAIIITSDDQKQERCSFRHVSSTCSGSGSAQIRRILRSPSNIFAGDSETLEKFATVLNTAELLHSALDQGKNIIVEGTQGFQLSLYHGDQYPFVTSRDTSASGCISEVGLSPAQVAQIIMAIRTFPIRVGKTGRLPSETTWEKIAEISHTECVEAEYGSVTNRPRRVGLFDLASVKKACMYNRPTGIALLGIDRIDKEARGVTSYSSLPKVALNYIKDLEQNLGVPIIFLGTGFSANEYIWRASSER